MIEILKSVVRPAVTLLFAVALVIAAFINQDAFKLLSSGGALTVVLWWFADRSGKGPSDTPPAPQ